MANAAQPTDFEPRRVLLVIEDETLAELLDELLTEAGHAAARLGEDGALPSLAQPPFDVILVDLDTRARDGAVIERLRCWSPASTIVALLPCGGLPDGAGRARYHVALEKPARVSAVLAAIEQSRKMQ